MATFKLEQGTAAAISLKNGEPMWQFVNRQFETDDLKLAEKMVKAGAVVVNLEEVGAEMKKAGKKAAKKVEAEEKTEADTQEKQDSEAE